MLKTMMSALRPTSMTQMACAVLAPPAYAVVKGAIALSRTTEHTPKLTTAEVIEMGRSPAYGSAAE